MSFNARKMIDFLCLDHMSHAGRENGRLMATYDQLEAYGLTRGLVSYAIDELVAFGFLKTSPRLRRIATTYQLTFYGTYEHFPPTNDWQRITAEKVLEIKAELALTSKRKLKNRNLV